MNSNRNSYTWTIDTLDELINANNGDVFKSHPFQLGNIEWLIELYPNGEAEHNIGCFIVLLQPTLIPTLWKKISYCRTIKCNETECSNTGITHIFHTKNTSPHATGWMDETMSFRQFQQTTNIHKTITFAITINILQVALQNDYILHIFKPKNTLPKQETLQWQINKALLSKFISAPQTPNGQIFESQIFNKMWCISCDIRPQATDMTIYLQLCSLPPHIHKISISYTFKCNQTKTIQNECDEFSLNHQSSGSKQAFINLSQLNNLKLDSIVIFLHIKYLRTYSKANETDDIEMKEPLQCHGNKTDTDKYKYALTDLITTMKAQLQPRTCHRSLKINKLRKLAQKHYARNKVVIESHNKNDAVYFDEIIKYLNTNKSQKNGRGNISIHCGDELIKQQNALKIFIIDGNDMDRVRNPLLIGQRGLKTRSEMKIPIGTVIGEYFGGEFLENEFDDIYHGTKQFVDINEYALSATVEVEIKHSRIGYFTNTHGNDAADGAEAENDYFVKQEFSVVIDGLNLECKRKAMLIYMNDCRRDINMTRKTKDDEGCQNVELVTVYHNGWPKIFAVAIQNIEGDSELLTFYGKSHVGWEQDKLRYESNHRFIRKNIKRVLDKHDIASI